MAPQAFIPHDCSVRLERMDVNASYMMSQQAEEVRQEIYARNSPRLAKVASYKNLTEITVSCTLPSVITLLLTAIKAS